jgi:hypothetical protein
VDIPSAATSATKRFWSTSAPRLAEGGTPERLHGQRFETIRQAKDETISWLFWYNRTRMHSTLK